MPDQPELRQRLTETLRLHHRKDKYDSKTRPGFRIWSAGCAGCDWSGELVDDGGFEAHVVQVLLALPGIAITQLPEPDEIVKNGSVFHAAPYIVKAVTDGEDAGFVDVDNRHILYRNARQLAAALLAAAEAAEEQTHA